jgi:phosphatidylglycerophosphatase A
MNQTMANLYESSTNPSLSNPGVLLATWFGAGYLPKAPGTWGSLGALPFAWVIAERMGSVGLVIASIAVFVIGIWAANIYMGLSGGDDPGPVVIDEVAGMWLTLAFVPPDIMLYGIGFLLFRIADIFKPWPAGWADRKVKGGLGVMLDDVLAALYSGGAVFALFYWKVI